MTPMTKTEIEDKVKAFLVEDFEIDEAKILPEARLTDDLDIDSLDLVDIIVIIHKTFGFMPKIEELANVETFDELCNYIKRRTN